MNPTQQNLKLWLARELERRGHGTRAKLARHLGVTSDIVTRMANTKPGKESREIALDELPAIKQFFEDHPVGGSSRRKAPSRDGITLAQLEKLAEVNAQPATDATEPSTLRGDFDEVQIRRVPLVGEINGGAWRQAVEDASEIITASGGGPNTFALKLRGDSMDQIAKPGAILFCDPDDIDLVVGRLYAVMNEQGETTFKQYLSNPPRLSPMSNNPEHKPIIIGAEMFKTIGRIVGFQTPL